jgi:aminopeptidase
MKSGKHDQPIDPYLPSQGNSGYRVSRYELDLAYKVVGNALTGRAAITAVATEERSVLRFDLADGLRVGKVSVATVGAAQLADPKAPAAKAGPQPKIKHAHRDGKLAVTLAEPLPAGAAFVVAISYSGKPGPVRSRWGEVGFEELTEGAMVASQPNGAPSWFPCDDHPSSKASYRISITTDSPFTAIANGALVSRKTRSSQTTWVYEMPKPTPTYLVTLQIGAYAQAELAKSPVPIRAFYPAKHRDAVKARFAVQKKIVEVFERLFGPYPFASYGIVVTGDDLEIPLEAQGISIFGPNLLGPGWDSERLVAHELAHQWFGNSLTLGQWRDIWLHEGFACYAEWLWSENSGGPTAGAHAHAHYSRLARQPDTISIADPGPMGLFDDRVYKRGALALHALRRHLGDTAFFMLLRTWTTEHAYGTVTTEQFIDTAARFGDNGARPLLESWLYNKPLPPM